ncbi:MAG: hypothetical protein ACRD1T_28100, partial [Acidimicrobiia bacterium]
MNQRRGWLILIVALALLAASCGGTTATTTTPAGPATTAGVEPTTAAGAEPTTTAATAEGLTFGMILVGPQDDHGWSQAHFEAGQYLEDQLGATMIVLDKVNPADRPDTS